jgi:NADH-quinone oxidoreductase subunit A
MLAEYVPVLITLLVSIGLASTFIVLATVLGPKRTLRVKMEPFECGVEPVANPRHAWHSWRCSSSSSTSGRVPRLSSR